MGEEITVRIECIKLALSYTVEHWANSNKGYYKNPIGIIEIAKEFEKYVIQDKGKNDDNEEDNVLR